MEKKRKWNKIKRNLKEKIKAGKFKGKILMKLINITGETKSTDNNCLIEQRFSILCFLLPELDKCNNCPVQNPVTKDLFAKRKHHVLVISKHCHKTNIFYPSRNAAKDIFQITVQILKYKTFSYD